MNCPRCHSTHTIKQGFIKGMPRRLCKDCQYKYTRETPRGKPQILKRLALHMYLEGLGFRSIGRILGVSNVSVLKWLKLIAQKVEVLREKDIEGKGIITTMELDEMRHYVGKKNKKSGSGLLLIEIPRKFWRGSSALVVKAPEKSYGIKSSI